MKAVKKIREGRQLKKMLLLVFDSFVVICWCFRYFCLNSGGRNLPREVVEIDFRPIFKKNVKYVSNVVFFMYFN